MANEAAIREPAAHEAAATTASELALLRLLQLVSPALPIGGYAYSHGLEWAVQARRVTDAASAGAWIGGLLERCWARLDVPVLARLYAATADGDAAAVSFWCEFVLACRETAELQAEDRHLGGALARVLAALNVPGTAERVGRTDTPYAAMLAAAAVHWGLTVHVAATACVWTYTEHQVSAAVKLVPLGQTDGQRLLHDLAATIPSVVETGLALSDEQIGLVNPGLAIASARHEHQHTRLFRS